MKEIKNYPFISVIIPVYNDNTGLITLLDSLDHQNYKDDLFEIIVVDNGSSEDVKRVTDQHKKVKLLYENDIQSSYAARNRGISVAQGKVLAFIDSDCRASEHWLKEGAKKLIEMNSDMVGGQIIFDISEKSSAAEYYDAIHNLQFDEKIKRGTCGAGNIFIKRSVFDAIGFFPQNLQSGGDMYFTKKATNSGFKLVYAPDAKVYHPARKFWSLAKKMFRVGAGKAIYTQMANESIGAGKVKIIQTGSIWNLFSFSALNKRIQKRKYNVEPVFFVCIWWTGCCVLAAGFMGLLYGKIQKYIL